MRIDKEKAMLVALSPVLILVGVLTFLDDCADKVRARRARRKGWTVCCGSCGEWMSWSMLLMEELCDCGEGYTTFRLKCPFCHGDPEHCGL